MARRAAIAIEMGRTRWAAVTEAATRTTRAASVAYATEESGSDAKNGQCEFLREERLAHLAAGPRTADEGALDGDRAAGTLLELRHR
jgi:hypothetical protein